MGGWVGWMSCCGFSRDWVGGWVGGRGLPVGEADLDQVHRNQDEEEGEGLDKVVEPVG